MRNADARTRAAAGDASVFNAGRHHHAFLLMPRFIAPMVVAATMVVGADVASGQNYPVKPIRVLTAEPGGGLDVAARIIAQGLTGSVGKQVIVENHGAGAFAAEIVAKAPADGYSLLLYGSNVWIAPFLRDDVPWDPVKDFSPITLAVRSPNLVVVHPSLPVKSVKELIALARARPGELNYASGSTGSSPHLAAELFKAMAHVNIVRVPYRGNAFAYADLVRGQVQLVFPTAGSVAPYLKSGRLRALAVTTAQRSELLPGLPTVAESGLPGYEAASIIGMFAPAATPAAIIGRLNDEVVRVLKKPEVKDRFFNMGVEAVGSSPEEFAATMKSEMARLGKMLRDAGIRDE